MPASVPFFTVIIIATKDFHYILEHGGEDLGSFSYKGISKVGD